MSAPFAAIGYFRGAGSTASTVLSSSAKYPSSYRHLMTNMTSEVQLSSFAPFGTQIEGIISAH